VPGTTVPIGAIVDPHNKPAAGPPSPEAVVAAEARQRASELSRHHSFRHGLDFFRSGAAGRTLAWAGVPSSRLTCHYVSRQEVLRGPRSARTKVVEREEWAPTGVRVWPLGPHAGGSINPQMALVDPSTEQRLNRFRGDLDASLGGWSYGWGLLAVSPGRTSDEVVVHLDRSSSSLSPSPNHEALAAKVRELAGEGTWAPGACPCAEELAKGIDPRLATGGTITGTAAGRRRRGPEESTTATPSELKDLARRVARSLDQAGWPQTRLSLVQVRGPLGIGRRLRQMNVRSIGATHSRRYQDLVSRADTYIGPNEQLYYLYSPLSGASYMVPLELGRLSDEQRQSTVRALRETLEMLGGANSRTT